MLWYMLDDAGEPVACPDHAVWAEFMIDAERRRVAWDEFDGVKVSTVFLGYALTGTARPLLWETMIFGGPYHCYSMQYSSREAALVGHQEAVHLVLNGEQ